MAVRSVTPMTNALTGYPLLEKLRDCRFVVDAARYNRALNGDPNARPQPQAPLVGRGTQVRPHSGGGWEAEIATYTVWINLADPALAFCPCMDFVNWGKDQNPPVLVQAPGCPGHRGQPALWVGEHCRPHSCPVPSAPPAPGVPFGEQIRELISQAVKKMADRVWRFGSRARSRCCWVPRTAPKAAPTSGWPRRTIWPSSRTPAWNPRRMPIWWAC